jgi:hypothetical protein
MSNIRTALLRWSIASVFMLAAVASTGAAQPSETDPRAASVTSSSSTLAAETAPNLAPSRSMASNCSFSSPCMVERTSAGWELDYGGPALYFDRSSDD